VPLVSDSESDTPGTKPYRPKDDDIFEAGTML
jgi:hypothetical protein